MDGKLLGKRILVVDDEIDLREIICEDLQCLGAEVFSAENGHTAFDLFKDIHPHALISDIRMPGGDGIELLKRVRADRSSPQPDIIFITGFADISPADAVLMGAQGMLSKPFNLHELRALLITCLTKGRSQPPSGGTVS